MPPRPEGHRCSCWAGPVTSVIRTTSSGTFFQAVNPQFGSFQNPEIFNKLDEAEAETDQARRAELYQEANRLIMDFLPGVPYVHNEPAVAFAEGVSGYEPGPLNNETLRTGHLGLSRPSDAALRRPAAAAADPDSVRAIGAAVPVAPQPPRRTRRGPPGRAGDAGASGAGRAAVRAGPAVVRPVRQIRRAGGSARLRQQHQHPPTGHRGDAAAVAGHVRAGRRRPDLRDRRRGPARVLRGSPVRTLAGQPVGLGIAARGRDPGVLPRLHPQVRLRRHGSAGCRPAEGRTAGWMPSIRPACTSWTA